MLPEVGEGVGDGGSVSDLEGGRGEKRAESEGGGRVEGEGGEVVGREERRKGELEVEGERH